MSRMILYRDRITKIGIDSAITSIDAADDDPNIVHMAIDGVCIATLPRRIVEDLNLCPNDVLDHERLEAIQAAIDIERLERVAMRFLGRREHGSLQLRTKLLRHQEDEKIVDTVMQRLLDAGWVNDARAAALVLEEETRSLPAGDARLRQVLDRRGLQGSDVDAALDAHLEAQDDAAAAEQIARKTLNKPSVQVMNKQKQCRRVISALTRRGFDEDTIDAQLRSLNLHPEDFQEF